MDVPGFIVRDGWSVAPVDDAFRTWLETTSAPRPWSVWQQMRVDLRSPRARLFYLAAAGLAVYAILRQSLPVAILSLVLVGSLVRSLMTTLRLRQRAVLGYCSIAFVEQEVGLRGVNKNVTVDDDRTMNVIYNLAGVRPHVSSGKEVDLQVLYDPKASPMVGHAIAYREVEYEDDDSAEADSASAATADSEGDAEGAPCALCNEPLVDGATFRVNGRIACIACTDKVQAEVAAQQPHGAPIFTGVLFGLLGALAGAAAWFAVAMATQLEVGYVAVLIGYLAGQGVKRGAGVQRGPLLQYIAAASSIVGLLAAKYTIFAHAVVALVRSKGGTIGYLDSKIVSYFPQALKESFSGFDIVFALIALGAAYRVPKAQAVSIVKL